MPPRAKAAETAADTEPLAPSPAPAHASQVCFECGQFDLHPSTTSFTCEHGTWLFVPAPTEPEAEAPPSDEDRLSAVLASLSTDQLQALLAAKAEGSQQ